MKLLINLTVWGVVLLALAPTTAFSQIVFSSQLQNGSVAIFQQNQPSGPVTQIQTGFFDTNFASLSRTGQFITFSTPDPIEPGSQVLPSSDLYIHDRTSGVSNRILNQQTEFLPGPSGMEMFTFLPEINALSPNGSEVIYSNRITRHISPSNLQRTNNLTVVSTSGSGVPVIVEEGSSTAFDFIFAEFLGVSWTPDGNYFATPAYLQVPTNAGPVVGIVRYTRNESGQFVRSAALSSPQLFSSGLGFSANIQIFPSYSPSGAALAYFDVYFPDSALLRAQATTRLIVANADGSGAFVRATFEPGFFPVGVDWSSDGSQLVYSIAPQIQIGEQFIAAGDPTEAFVRAVDPFSNDPIFQLAGINGGFLPNLPAVQVINPPVDLTQINLILTRTPGGDFTLSAQGLDPSANYILESSVGLQSFTNGQLFSGEAIAGGISIPFETTKFFRLRNP